jgi:hypothetical protein
MKYLYKTYANTLAIASCQALAGFSENEVHVLSSDTGDERVGLHNRLVHAMNYPITHQMLAGITLFDMVLDLMGALYLTYDLLGGRKGPLRALTEIFTFVVVGVGTGIIGFIFVMFMAARLNLHIVEVLGYEGTLGAGLGFGVGGGIGLGIGWAFNLLLRRENSKSFKSRLQALRLSIIRAITVGIVMGGAAGLTIDHIHWLARGAWIPQWTRVWFAVWHRWWNHRRIARRSTIGAYTR